MTEIILAAIEVVISFIFIVVSIHTFLDTIDSGNRNKALRKLYICVTMIMLLDVASWAGEGRTDMLSVISMKVGCFALFALSYLHIVFFLDYFLTYVTLTRRQHILSILVRVICAALFTAAVFSEKFRIFYYIDENNVHHRGPYFIYSYVLSILALLIIVYFVVYHRKNYGKETFMAFLSFFIFPLIFMIIQWYAKLGLQFTNVGFAMSLILLFIVHEREKTTIIINQQKKIIEQQKGLIEKENELSDMKITLFESQIKPHFVFNVLNTIYMLCDMDVEKAKTAISEFSEYFRSNAELIETRGTIPFLRELEHVQGYLSLEKIRFGDKIEVLYDLKENGFEIPPYTLQSIVENAVKHGVGKKKEGGRLIIRTGKNDDEYFIIVEDNGVGFDVKETTRKADSMGMNIGIRNISERLRYLCKGNLEIESEVGVGTKVTISIPFEEGTNGNEQ